MSPFASSEDGKNTCKSNISFGKSVKVNGKAKQIDLMRNTDCRERSNLFHAIDIGCIFNQIEKKKSSIIAGAQRYCFKVGTIIESGAKSTSVHVKRPTKLLTVQRVIQQPFNNRMATKSCNKHHLLEHPGTRYTITDIPPWNNQ